ncbi:hypothetical protein SODALDRAFT_357302 [Sodiomyces alkalinus F11]|uniref:CSN8/PSMD8/EIF3K domain-containing protein n=1 Tax=Sodiomyces alkalinus (strain CBS 110278 / VKM F-3762 / F11) TaxID=1314773 RepID=A0A3N2Q3C8_SODAK|nr:hypothetical protein SODALDRAFT_357302 [Sodiomyces alkalinus F11]ROT41269.1 hypothetical protein SODALDRAFT_357302 [Sodiomyces alkalinus F11]
MVGVGVGILIPVQGLCLDWAKRDAGTVQAPLPLPASRFAHPYSAWLLEEDEDEDEVPRVLGEDSNPSTKTLSKALERYYTKIVERYMTFCSDAGQRDELLRRFAALELSSPSTTCIPSQIQRATTKTTATTSTSASASASPPTSTPPPPSPPPPDPTAQPLSDILPALRKLREGIVASHRADDFATQVYLFAIRLSILVKHPESYHPAILHLLRVLHPRQPLTSVEHAEVAAYLVLDAACRRADLAAAYALRSRHGLRDAKVDAALAALAHDNYVAFRRVRRAVDGHRARLMEFADEEMRGHALKCLGRSYLSVDRPFLERCAGATWELLTARDGVGWELDGEKVVIRRVKGR